MFVRIQRTFIKLSAIEAVGLRLSDNRIFVRTNRHDYISSQEFSLENAKLKLADLENAIVNNTNIDL